MAELASAWRTYGSGALMRAELYLTDPPVITKDTANVNISALLRIRTTSTISDSINSNVLSGSMSASDPNKSVVHGSSGGVTETCLGIASFATVYGSPVTVSVTGTLTNYEIVSGSTAVAGSVTIPARPYQLPAAPTGVGVTRNSDTSHTVTWTRNPSTPGPYQSQQVQRSTDGGAWAQIASVSGTATSYTDTTTSADHSYQWRVVATNTTGTATSAASTTLYTTPKAPGTPTAVKSGANIVLSFTNTARHDTGIKVYASQDGGAFALLATVLAANLTTYTHTSPSTSVTWAYRVATYNGALISAQSASSNTVQLAAPPNAPTGLGPSTIRDATEDVTWSWTHNPVDSSPQSGFEVRHREAGEVTWTTVTVTSSVSQWILPGGTYANPETVEWQVRTKGLDPSYGAWSATATSPTSTRPTVTITSPADGSTLDTSQLVVSWAYFDAEGAPQSAWIARLVNSAGTIVEEQTVAGAATTTTFATAVADGTSWTVRVMAADTPGLWSAIAAAAFTVAYALPAAPTVDLTWDPATAAVTVAITNPEVSDLSFPFGYGEFGDGGFGGDGFGGGGGVPTDHNEVWRSIDGGPWELIASGVPPNTTTTDWSPTVAGTNAYRVDAVSALPSTATSAAVEQVTAATGLWVSGGPGFSQVCLVRSNVEIGIETGRAVKVLRQYAGRDYPIERTGTARWHSLTIDADILAVRVQQGLASAPAAWEALADLAGPHLWRDLDGRYVQVSLGAVSMRRLRGGHVYRLSVTATRVDA